MHKFFVKINSITRQVYPLNADKLTLATNKESGKLFYRKKLNGTPMFSGSDYTFFKQIEDSFSRCTTLTMEIHKKCGGVYSLDWEGEFGMNSGKWNPDKKTVEFDIEVLDIYTDILKNAKTKINILDLPGGNSVDATISGYYFEYASCGGFTTNGNNLSINGCNVRFGLQAGVDPNTFSTGPGLTAPSFDNLVGCEDLVSGDGWVPYKATYQKAVLVNLIPAEYMHAYSMQFIREYRETVDVDGVAEAPPGSGWIELDGKVERNGFIYSRWARPPFGELSPTYLWVINPGCTINAFLEISTGTVDTFNRNRLFNDAMEYVVENAFDMEIISDFFSLNGDDTYPDNEAYTEAKANLATMLIAQKSDIIDPYSSEAARKGELTFEGLQEIWSVFNCTWKVIDGVIRVEHESYWENIGLFDLTQSQYEKYSKCANSYEYEKEVLPKLEEFKFMEDSVNADFLGLPIEYDSICVNQDPDSNVKSFIANINTDITFIRTYRDAIAKEGFVLMVHEDGVIKAEVGRISNIELPNNHLSWANLHWNYHRHGRVLRAGIMNGETTEFFSAIKTKKQQPIIIPFCCASLDSGMNIKTFLGTGNLVSMEESLYTGTAKIEVIHDVGELSGSLEDRQFDDSFDLSFN